MIYRDKIISNEKKNNNIEFVVGQISKFHSNINIL